MLFRFLILSDEADDFKREIKIDSESTFLDLQNAILDSVGYTKDQMTSFFICDDDWSKKTEITLVEMDTSSEEDSYVMADTQLEELLDTARNAGRVRRSQKKKDWSRWRISFFCR